MTHKSLAAVSAGIISVLAFTVSLTNLTANSEGSNNTFIVPTENGTFSCSMGENSTAIIESCEITGESIDIPEKIGGFTVTEIADRAFFGQMLLTSVTLPESIKSIGDYAFSGCLSLEEIDLPDSVSELGTGCFTSCTELKTAVLSSSLEYIPDNCFYACPSLQSVDIPASVKIIGKEAFFGCTDIMSIFVPPSVTSISENALGMHYNLRNTESGVQTRTIETISGFKIIGSPYSAAAEYSENYGIELDSSVGDVNSDGFVDSVDASLALAEYTMLSTGHAPSFSAYQTFQGDYNFDGMVDSVDASIILSEYARRSTA